MKSLELRVGNWVDIKADTEGTLLPDVVTGILADGRIFAKSYLDIAINDEDIHFIEISDDILEMAGFSPCETGIQYTTYRKDEISIVKDSRGYYICWEDGRESSISIIGEPFQYLHQLQNVMLILAGQEIKIEL